MRYLEGGQVENSEAVEEAQAVHGHLHGAGSVAVLGAGGAGLGAGAVEQDAVQHVQHPHQVRGLQSRAQPRGLLPPAVEHAAAPAGDSQVTH